MCVVVVVVVVVVVEVVVVVVAVDSETYQSPVMSFSGLLAYESGLCSHCYSTLHM